MREDLNFDALKDAAASHFTSLKHFHFHYKNPLFWVFLFALFLILARPWQAKKSFSFCSVIAVVLLATTKIEGFISMDPVFVRLVSFFVIAIVLLYYVALKR